jgi:antitoxin (DNA-binding transcriptional repressor) of toxin-antitoxin stability system
MSDYIDPPDEAPARVGVRELKTHAARIVRQIRETRASFVLTHRGQAVGVILPLDPKQPAMAAPEDTGGDEGWEAFLRAGRRIQHRFSRRKSGVRLLSESRR